MLGLSLCLFSLCGLLCGLVRIRGIITQVTLTAAVGTTMVGRSRKYLFRLIPYSVCLYGCLHVCRHTDTVCEHMSSPALEAILSYQRREVVICHHIKF